MVWVGVLIAFVVIGADIYAEIVWISWNIRDLCVHYICMSSYFRDHINRLI